MKNLEKNFQRILTLLDEAKEIKGRTKFQKIVYILKSKGLPFDEKFKYHYYGPFSPDLQLELEELTDRNMVIEKYANPYVYQLNREFITNLEKDEILNKYKNLIEFINNQDYKKLELVSTIFFIESSINKKEDVIKRKVISLKPHLKTLIEDAFELKKKIEDFSI